MNGRDIRLGRISLFEHTLLAAVLMGLTAGVTAFTGANATGVAICGSSQQKEPDSPDVPRITTAELKERIAKHEKLLIIDSRGQGSYDKSDKKIEGAIRVPPNRIRLEEIESYIKDSAAREIVIYCS